MFNIPFILTRAKNDSRVVECVVQLGLFTHNSVDQIGDSLFRANVELNRNDPSGRLLDLDMSKDVSCVDDGPAIGKSVGSGEPDTLRMRLNRAIDRVARELRLDD